MATYKKALHHDSLTGYKITFAKHSMTTSVRYWINTNRDIYLSACGTLKYFGWRVIAVQPITINGGYHDSKMQD